MVGRTRFAPMPLTLLQKDTLAVLAANRSEKSHFAGGIVLNASADSPRFSRDFDIFHELAAEVTGASNRDVKSLRNAGFDVEIYSPHGEWEKDVTFRRAKIVRDNEVLEIDWVAAGQRFMDWNRKSFLPD
jgi:hypothetical protein